VPKNKGQRTKGRQKQKQKSRTKTRSKEVSKEGGKQANMTASTDIQRASDSLTGLHAGVFKQARGHWQRPTNRPCYKRQTTLLQLSTQKFPSWVAKKGACGRRQVQIPFTNWANIRWIGSGGRRERRRSASLRARYARLARREPVAAAQPHNRCHAARSSFRRAAARQLLRDQVAPTQRHPEAWGRCPPARWRFVQ
jgi:hypothetical protein